MRQRIVAGNWKMNTNISEGVYLAKNILQIYDSKDIKVILAPPFVSINEVSKTIEGSLISTAAQNCSTEESGAYTGEVSCSMIKATGAEFVIIGHSERRAYYHENDEILAKKVKLTLKHQLTPIFCCGEVLADREMNNHFTVVSEQIKNALFDLSKDDFEKIVIAYEPVWAIGTGVTASPDQAQEMHAHIRRFIKEKYGEDTGEKTSILYGGSCKPNNAKELFSQIDVDGGLIGGASLKAEDFNGIIKAF